jgi:hypothetical protein
MGISLNHPVAGAQSWFPDVDANWTTLENQYVARQNSDASIVSVTATTAETALMSNATIPANALGVGTVLVAWGAFTIQVPSLTTPTVTLRLRWGGLSGVLLWTTTLVCVSRLGGYTVGVTEDLRLVGVTAGASGSVEADGWLGMSDPTKFGFAAGTSGILAGLTTGTTTIDTTASKLLVWTTQSTVSGVTVKQRQQVVEKG